jgi:hypothetical protein
MVRLMIDEKKIEVLMTWYSVFCTVMDSTPSTDVMVQKLLDLRRELRKVDGEAACRSRCCSCTAANDPHYSCSTDPLTGKPEGLCRCACHRIEKVGQLPAKAVDALLEGLLYDIRESRTGSGFNGPIYNYRFDKKAKERVEEFVAAQCADLQTRLDEATKYAVCMYCGHKQPKIEPYDREKAAMMLAEHTENCPTHPINQLLVVKKERDELQRVLQGRGELKTWIHSWLDSHGVPIDPDPVRNRETGCRIECRMNWLWEVIQKLRKALQYVIEVRAIKCSHKHPGPDQVCARCIADEALKGSECQIIK